MSANVYGVTEIVGTSPDGVDAAIEVEKDGNTVCGTSIMGLMMLGAAKGDTITISATGFGADIAVDRLCALVEALFDEKQ